MRAQRTRDTAAELAVRRALHAAGVRFRVGLPVRVPGWPRQVRPDVVLTRAHVALFVDGCWWHGCQTHFRVPKSNGEWWVEKIRRNVERDAGQSLALADDGWTVVRVWECAVRREVPAPLVELVAACQAHGPDGVGVVLEQSERLGVRAVRRTA